MVKEMHRRVEGERLKSVYEKYKDGRKVEIEDLDALDALAYAHLIEYRYQGNEIYTVPVGNRI